MGLNEEGADEGGGSSGEPRFKERKEEEVAEVKRKRAKKKNQGEVKVIKTLNRQAS
jgi:hypothetical protein